MLVDACLVGREQQARGSRRVESSVDIEEKAFLLFFN